MAEDRPADRELLARLLNAIRNGDLEAARAALTEGAPVEGIRGAPGRWPLAEAIMEDDPAVVKFLLETCDPRSERRHWHHALQRAGQFKRRQLIGTSRADSLVPERRWRPPFTHDRDRDRDRIRDRQPRARVHGSGPIP